MSWAIVFFPIAVVLWHCEGYYLPPAWLENRMSSMSAQKEACSLLLTLTRSHLAAFGAGSGELVLPVLVPCRWTPSEPGPQSCPVPVSRASGLSNWSMACPVHALINWHQAWEG